MLGCLPVGGVEPSVPGGAPAPGQARVPERKDTLVAEPLPLSLDGPDAHAEDECLLGYKQVVHLEHVAGLQERRSTRSRHGITVPNRNRVQCVVAVAGLHTVALWHRSTQQFPSLALSSRRSG